MLQRDIYPTRGGAIHLVSGELQAMGYSDTSRAYTGFDDSKNGQVLAGMISENLSQNSLAEIKLHAKNLFRVPWPLGTIERA